MEYRTADTIGRTSLSALTARMMNQKDIGLLGGLTEASKMKFEAARTRVKSKFDPLNIVRALTFKSPMLTAAAGKLMGRSKRDISYFTGGRYGDDSLGETPTTSRRKNDGVYHTRIGPGKSTNLKVGDGIADILAKLYNLNRLVHSDNKKLELSNKISEEEKEQERNRFLKSLFGENDDKSKIVEPDKVAEEGNGLLSSVGVAKLLSSMRMIFSTAAFVGIAGAAVWAIIKGKFPGLTKEDNLNDYIPGYTGSDKTPDLWVDQLRQKGQKVPASMSDIEYLQATSMLESSGGQASTNPRNSKVLGPFQFNENTWASVVKKMGKNWTMQDRLDPTKSTQAAQWLAKDNEQILKSKLNRPVTQQELYMAHVLGAPKAAEFIKQKEQSPRSVPSSVLPKDVMENNKEYFYRDPKTMQGPLTNQEVYDKFFANYNKNLEKVRSGQVPEMVRNIPQMISTESAVRVTPRETVGKILRPDGTASPGPIRIDNQTQTGKIQLNSSANPLYSRIQTASSENVNIGGGNRAPMILAPVTNNYVGAGGKGSPQNSFNSGVAIPVRNDEPGIYLAQTKYSLFKTT